MGVEIDIIYRYCRHLIYGCINIYIPIYDDYSLSYRWPSINRPYI